MSAADLQPGDAVKVKGLRGEFLLTSWREEPSGLVANVIGGTRSHRMFRSVTADRVQRPRQRREEASDVR
jgi:NAD(P)H-flavin reductase